MEIAIAVEMMMGDESRRPVIYLSLATRGYKIAHTLKRYAPLLPLPLLLTPQHCLH